MYTYIFLWFWCQNQCEIWSFYKTIQVKKKKGPVYISQDLKKLVKKRINFLKSCEGSTVSALKTGSLSAKTHGYISKNVSSFLLQLPSIINGDQMKLLCVLSFACSIMDEEN